MKIRIKNILLIALLISANVQLNAQKNEVHENGYNIFYYPNGQISSEGEMKDGKPEGLWKTYYTDGTIKSLGKRKNFLLDSMWNFYDEHGIKKEEISYLRGKKNGYQKKYISRIAEDSTHYPVLISQELFLNDKKEGLAYYFDEDGKIFQTMRYKDGKKHGIAKEFDQDSIIKIVYEYHNDFLIDRESINRVDSRGDKQGIWRIYWQNDRVKAEMNYKNGLLHGFYREYAQSGKLLKNVYYEHGEMIQKQDEDVVEIEIKNRYDEDGKLISSGGYKNDVPVGVHRNYGDDKSVIQTKEYNQSGKVISEGQVNEKGQMNDYWKYYYEDGSLKMEGAFVNNKRSGTWKFYYASGAIEQEGSYKEGLEEGNWKWYYPEGELHREEEYYRGKEDGISVEYSKEGEILIQGEYIEGNEEGEWLYKIGDYIESGKYAFGLKDGLWKGYFTKGEKQFEGKYVQGQADGKHRYFYDNGKLKEERYYQMGIREGNWKKFDPEGNIYLFITYRNNSIVKIDGKRVNIEEE